jgi:hypothetical protein
MNWLKVALGLVKEAADTEVGQEVINNMRSSIRKEPPAKPNAPSPVDVEALLLHHRAQVNQNLEAIVHTLNQQHTALETAMRRQRIWNYALAGALVLVLVVALLSAR